MTSRAAKRAKKRSKRIGAARSQVGNVKDLPRPLRLVVDNHERLADYVASRPVRPRIRLARSMTCTQTSTRSWRR